MKNIEQLNKLALDSESADKGVFAEMRSSVLLIAGEHYSRLGDRFYERIRTSKDLTQESKVRLTKNHIGKIHKLYVNNILSYAPGVFIDPHNESELSDIKAAELTNAIWQDAKSRLSYEDLVQSWCDDFCAISEVWTKVYFDENAGELVGYEQQIDDFGAPSFDELGQPVADKSKPRFRGEICFEEVHAFNVFRDATAKSLKDSGFLGLRKMVPVDRLKKMFPEEEKQKSIVASADKTFLVFDAANGGYRKSDTNECLVREYYFKPCHEYPEGYYYITTETAILDEGVLPYGIFPLEYELFDKAQTSPRGRGIIKQLRPYQIEINRCASKIAEHQMTLGDDKLVIQNGSKVSAGGQVPGVRAITVTGAAPTVIPGRNGNQFLEYMQTQIAEMYMVAMVAEDSQPDKSNGQLDPYSLLFKSAAQKKAFKRYIARFERFLTRVCNLYLEMAKKYLPDDAVVNAVGKNEQVNIREFKNTKKLSVQIKVEPRSDDIETIMGKQLVLNHLIQYTGNQLAREDLGKLIKQMPYANVDDTFSDFTLDYETATNMILALDRGEIPEISPADPQEYIVKRLDARMRQADFKQLHPFIQTNYREQRDMRLQIIEDMKQKALREQAGMIPQGGALIDAGAWLPNPNDPTKTVRMRLPQDSVYWLYQKLQDQGYMLAELNRMSPELNYIRQTRAAPEVPPPQAGIPQG